MWGNGPPSFFRMSISSCLSTICWRDYFLHHRIVLATCWKSTDHRCMVLFLNFQFYSIGIYVYPYSGNTVLITIDMGEVLILGSVILPTFFFFNTVSAILQHFHMNFSIIFSILQKGYWYFGRVCTESIILFWMVLIFKQY